MLPGESDPPVDLPAVSSEAAAARRPADSQHAMSMADVCAEVRSESALRHNPYRDAPEASPWAIMQYAGMRKGTCT